MKSYIKKLLREGLLGEEIVSGKYYHGSAYPKIIWGLAPEEYDKSLYGYGIYVTTSKGEGIAYATDEGGRDGYLFSMKLSNLNIVEFDDEVVSSEIKDRLELNQNFYNGFNVKFNDDEFDISSGNYDLGSNISYEWYFVDDDESKEYNIKKGYYFERHVDNDLVNEEFFLTADELLDNIKSYNDVGVAEYVEISDIEIYRDEIFNNYRNLYFYISTKLNSIKAASKFIATLGIDGFRSKSVGVDGIHLNPDDYIVCIINPSKINDVDGKKVTSNHFKKLIDLYNEPI
jgi:hypothetical protein